MKEEVPQNSHCNIANTLRGSSPTKDLPFCDIKNTILGKKYNLSLVLTANHISKRLNKEYRKKNYPTNVLSFPLNKYEGEIFINVRKAEKEAVQFSKTPKKFIGFLFIHGLLHLKG